MTEPDFALRAEELTVVRGKREVVSGVTLSVPYGSVHALVGPNGAGKSTLLKALVGLLPSTGRLLLAGQSADAMRGDERARVLGYVPQQTLLATGARVADVVQQGRYAARSPWQRFATARAPEVEAALAQTDLLALAERRFNTLSGGEQRRVLMARALATGARLLLLDEPTAGLDVGHVLRLFALLRELAQAGHAVVVVLHDLADVQRHADHASLLHQGRLLAQGPVEDVLRPEPILEAYGVHLGEGRAPSFRLAAGAP